MVVVVAVVPVAVLVPVGVWVVVAFAVDVIFVDVPFVVLPRRSCEMLPFVMFGSFTKVSLFVITDSLNTAVSLVVIVEFDMFDSLNDAVSLVVIVKFDTFVNVPLATLVTFEELSNVCVSLVKFIDEMFISFVPLVLFVSLTDGELSSEEVEEFVLEALVVLPVEELVVLLLENIVLSGPLELRVKRYEEDPSLMLSAFTQAVLYNKQ